MLTAPMMYRGIDVNLPRSGGKAHGGGGAAGPDDHQGPPPLPQRAPAPARRTLEARLRDLLRDRADRTLFIKADKDLAYGHVVETMDRVRRAGVERVGMVTEPLPRRE